MYIAKILSNLGAWGKIQQDYPTEFAEILDAIKSIEIHGSIFEDVGNGKLRISRKLRDIGIQLNQNLERCAWEPKNVVFGKTLDRGFSNIDVVKSGIGLEAVTGKFAFVESDVFVKFPMFMRPGLIEFGVIVVLVKSLTPTGSGMSSFEMIRRRLKMITPYMPRYPFVIIGISNTESEIQVEELSSDLDLFLVKNIGITYSELRLQQERQDCDFKVTLPQSSDDVAKEICAFANNRGGGVLLIGVNNDGDKVGIPIAEKDKMQLRIGNIAKDSCKPGVVVSFHSFKIDNDQTKSLLAVRINEVDRKPCMFQGRIYIRDNATAVPGNPDQVRRLLLGNLS